MENNMCKGARKQYRLKDFIFFSKQYYKIDNAKLKLKLKAVSKQTQSYQNYIILKANLNNLCGLQHTLIFFWGFPVLWEL